MSDTNYTKEEILAAQKALRLLYDEIKSGKGIFPDWIKVIIHRHQNKYSDLIKQFK